MNEYIQPLSRTEWPSAENIHHISPEMVQNSKTLRNFMPSIQGIINSADLIVGYNTVFDLMFLTIAGLSLPEQVIICDVMRDFAPIYGDWNDYFSDYTWKTLSTCASYFNYQISEDAFHNSLEDVKARLNSDKVLFSFARGRERCDLNGHAVFLRPGVDFATTGSEITGISTSSTKLK